MRVFYDAYWWASGPPSNREVMRETFRAWAEHSDDEFVLFTRHRDRELVALEASQIAKRNVTVVTTRLAPHGIAVLIAMQLHRRHVNADAVFTQNFSVRGRNSFVFLHDVLFLSNPAWFSAIERLYFSLMSLTAGRARRIFTSSESEATRIKTYLRLQNTTAVGLGPRQSMLRAEPEAPSESLRSQRFMLAVGRFNVRKNLARAVEAAVSSGRISDNYPLVVVGDPIPRGSIPQAEEAIERGRVITLGFVSDSQLRWLYENCGTFIMVSLGEGFGMPVAEAATFERTSVLSKLDVFREIAEDAYEANPVSVESISHAIQRAVDERRPTKLRQPLSWSAVASKIRNEIGATL